MAEPLRDSWRLPANPDTHPRCDPLLSLQLQPSARSSASLLRPSPGAALPDGAPTSPRACAAPYAAASSRPASRRTRTTPPRAPPPTDAWADRPRSCRAPPGRCAEAGDRVGSSRAALRSWIRARRFGPPSRQRPPRVPLPPGWRPAPGGAAPGHAPERLPPGSRVLGARGPMPPGSTGPPVRGSAGLHPTCLRSGRSPPPCRGCRPGSGAGRRSREGTPLTPRRHVAAPAPVPPRCPRWPLASCRVG